ncbi:hypothetical protein BSKO_12694 [Bryopsis sp. KO-2023]|nr:hypothetical protein BSKO_12694 [Bryopsis sp. KO-2023]
MMAALPWLLAAILMNSSAWVRSGAVDRWPSRGLLGERVKLSQDALSDLGVPQGAKLLAQFQSHCPDPAPLGIETKIALSCSNINNFRRCMGVGPKAPTFVGRGCRGQSCIMDFVPGPGTCFLTNLGVNVNPHDPALNSTCGIFKEDSHWIDPVPKPGYGLTGKKCFSPEDPDLISTHLWVDCKNGKLGVLHKIMNFSSSAMIMPEKDLYTCKYSPMCTTDGKPIWRLACYLQEDIVPMTDIEGPPVHVKGMNGSFPLKLAQSLLLLAFILICKFVA